MYAAMSMPRIMSYVRLLYCIFWIYYFGAFIVLKFVLRGVNEVKPKNSWLIEISMMKNNNDNKKLLW